MMYSSQTITALAKPLPGQSSKGGSGTVERRVDPSTYVINIGREKVTVKVTEGALAVGQQVTVAVRNDKFIITPAQTQTPDTDRADADSFTQRGVLRTPQNNVRADLEVLISRLSTRPFSREDAKNCEQLFKTMEGKLSSLDKPLTGATSSALNSLSEAVAADAPVPEAVVQKVVSLVQQLRDKIPAPPATPLSGRSVALQAPVSEGLYKFTSVSEALDFLKPPPASREAFARELESLVAKDGSVTVRAEVYKNQDTVATIMTREDVSRELESLPGRFTSRAFQSIPPSVFGKLLENRGRIDFEQLKALDAFAAEMRLPAASQRAGSRVAQEAALLQWLTTAYDARTPTAALSSLLPTFSASSIVDSLEEFAYSASKLSGTPLPLPAAEEFSITQRTLAGAVDRSKLIESVISRLGFNLENSLANEGGLDGPSLKQQLLETSRTLETGQSPSTATGQRAQQSFTKITDEFVASVRTRLAPLLATASEGASGRAESGVAGALRQDIEAALQKGATGLRELLEGLTVRATGLVQTLPEKLGLPSRSAINGFAADAAKQIEAQVKELSRDLEAVVKKNAAGVAALMNQGAGETAKRINSLLGELVRNSQGQANKDTVELAGILEKVSRQLEEISPKAPASDPEPRATQKTADAFQRIITALAGDTGKRIEQLLTGITLNTQGTVRKNAIELAGLIERISGRDKEPEPARTSVPAPEVAQKSAEALQKIITTFTGDSAGRMVRLLGEISSTAHGAVRKNALELSRLIEQVSREARETVQAQASGSTPEVTRKSSEMLQKIVTTLAGNPGRRLDALLSEIVQNTQGPVRKNADEVARLIDQVSSRALEIKQNQTGVEKPEVAQKTTAAIQKAINTFAGETGKRIETHLNEIAEGARGQARTNSAEFARLIEQLASRGKEYTQSPPPVQTPGVTQKSAEAIKSLVTSLTGDAAKRIEHLLNDIARNTQGPVRKNNIELAGLIEQTVSRVKEIQQAQPSIPAPEASQKSTEALKALVNTFSGDTGKRIDDLIIELSKNTQGSAQKNAVELATLIEQAASQIKEIRQNQPTVPTPETSQKSSEALQKVINTFSGDTGKRIDDLINELSKNTQGPAQKNAIELATLIEQAANQAKEIKLAQTSVPTPETSQKSSDALQKVINTFSGDSGKHINDLIIELSKNTAGTARKNVVDLANIIEQVSNQVREIKQAPSSIPASEETNKTAVSLRKVIDTFSGNSAKHIENILNDLSRNTQVDVRKTSVELGRLLEQVAAQAKEISLSQSAVAEQGGSQKIVDPAMIIEQASRRVNQTLSGANAAARPQPEKLATLLQSAIETFTGDTGKRIESLLSELTQNTEVQVRKNAAELSGLFIQISNTLGDPVPEKLSAPSLAILRAFSNAADTAKLLNQPTDELDAVTMAQVRTLPAKLTAAIQSALDSFMVNRGKPAETIPGNGSLENSIATLQKNAAEFSGQMDRLVFESTATANAPSSRLAINSFVNDAAKRFEIVLKQFELETRETLQKGSIDFSKFLNRLTEEAELFANVLSLKTTLPGISIPNALTSGPEILFEKQLRTTSPDVGLLQQNATFAPEPLPGESARTLSAKLRSLLQSTIDAFAGEAADRTEKLQQTLSRINEGSLQKGIDEFSKLFRQLISEADGLVQGRGTVNSGDWGTDREPVSRAAIPTSEVSPQKTDGPRPPGADNVQELTRSVRELPEKLIASLRWALDAFAEGAEKHLSTRVSEVSHQLEQLVKQEAALLSGRAAALLSAMHSALEKELPALLRNTEDLKPLVSRTTETLIRDLLHDRNNPSAAGAKPEDALKDAGPSKDDQSLIRQAVRQNIDTVLNRFESLQILARQVQNPAGEQQQILAVPIKIGTEWTEMHVRFVHKKRKNNGGTDGHYSVYLNVAPALLGAIGATMEYTKNKDLNISMHFEHHATRQWFAANKAELAETIGALGLPSPRITLFMERKAKSASAIAPTSVPGSSAGRGTSNALLDVKA